MNYAITGYLGFIAPHLEKALRSAGWKCVAKRDPRNKVSFDFPDPIKEKVDVLFLLGAQTRIKECIKHPFVPLWDNVWSLGDKLEWARKNKVKKVIYFSSSRVLNNGRNPYVASKIYGEELCRAYRQCYGMNAVIIRPSTVFGPGEDKSERIVSKFCKAALRNGVLKIYGKPDKELCFTYIDDFISAIMRIVSWMAGSIAVKGEWNIWDSPMKVLDFANEVIRQAGGGSVRFYPAELSQPQHQKYAAAEIVTAGCSYWDMGDCFSVKVIDGIRRTLDWYRKEGTHGKEDHNTEGSYCREKI